MKATLLELVQSILSDMDSEDVNSIDDTVEAQQVASVIKDTFNQMIASRMIPEHQELLKLTSLSDADYPTHFKYEDDIKSISDVWYNVSEDGGIEYRELHYLEPKQFLRLYAEGTDSDTITDVNGGTKYFVGNTKMPKYFTTFDDYHIVMDSYDSDIESTLQNSKIRCLGYVYPTFTISDTYVPDLDATMFPYLLAEAKSACFSMFKSGSDPKVEQAARRQKSYIQNDIYRNKRANKRPMYGKR